MHMNAFAHRDKRIWDPLELELQEVVSFVVLLLGIELGASVRAVCTLSCGTVSSTLPTPINNFSDKRIYCYRKNMD